MTGHTAWNFYEDPDARRNPRIAVARMKRRKLPVGIPANLKHGAGYPPCGFDDRTCAEVEESRSMTDGRKR